MVRNIVLVFFSCFLISPIAVANFCPKHLFSNTAYPLIVTCTDDTITIQTVGLPDYGIASWFTNYFPNRNNPNRPTAINRTVRLPLNPIKASNVTPTPMGPIAIAINGVALFNPKSAETRQNGATIFYENAVTNEFGLDRCYGHPAMIGEYHYHQNPRCIYQDKPGKHSQIVGYAYDGFPIYGPQGYSVATDAKSLVRRMQSCYKLNSNRSDIAVSEFNFLGKFNEDFYFAKEDYRSRNCDLDLCNGREGPTPEYPNGIYHYHITIDENGSSAYPYIIGCYRGQVDTQISRRGSSQNRRSLNRNSQRSQRR